jgi:spermidine synthase
LFGTAELVRDHEHPSAWAVTVNGVLQSYVDLADPTNLAMPYTDWIAQVVDRHWEAATPIRAVHLGGGGYSIPRYVAAMRPGSDQTVYEIDGQLVDLIGSQLGLTATPGLRIRVQDGRTGIDETPDATTDLVVQDVFRGGEIATELATVEFVHRVARVLRPGGLYTTNLWDGGDLGFALRAVAAVGEVFAHVLVLAETDVLTRERPGNLVVAASNRELPVTELESWAATDSDPVHCLNPRQLSAMCGSAPPLTETSPLTSTAPAIRRRRD